MKHAILFLALIYCPILRAQENTFRLNVLGYQWTTTHNTVTFTWPGHSNTSCSGSAYMNGNVSGGGNYSASGTGSSTCSTTYTPPTTQNIDIQKPVVFILADTGNSRMVLTCTRNVRWSQCHALNPGMFLGRSDHGHFEVQAAFGMNKEEWIRYDIVQQAAISRQQTQNPPAQEAAASIEAPKAETAGTNSGFPVRWKSMVSGHVRTLRFEGEYIYGEVVISEAAVKAGAFALMEVKKDGDKYVGKTNAHDVRTDGGASCSFAFPIELTLVTPDRIEGRAFTPPANAKIDWNTCTYSPPPDWQSFTWIPVR
jgi:hypothetical protein